MKNWQLLWRNVCKTADFVFGANNLLTTILWLVIFFAQSDVIFSYNMYTFKSRTSFFFFVFAWNFIKSAALFKLLKFWSFCESRKNKPKITYWGWTYLLLSLINRLSLIFFQVNFPDFSLFIKKIFYSKKIKFLNE